MGTCPNRETLQLLLDGKVTGEDWVTLSDHLETCPACRELLDRLSADPVSCRWRRWHNQTDPPDDTTARLLRRLVEEALPSGDAVTPHSEGTPFVRLSSPPGYEVLDEIGRGGVGVVYRARQLALGRTVALKVLLAGQYANDEERARFRSEAEAAARLQHANIVQIFDIGEHEGRPFLALEFIEGPNLSAQSHRAPWMPHAAAQLVEVLARAVHYAHHKGVVHRDLKPANVLLDANVPKITDFGLAKLLDRPGQTETGRILGTPSYMAPEQARGQAQVVGPSADVYALGAILYELLTGRPPFQGVTPVDTIVHVLHEDLVPPRRLQPKIPRDLETVCLKCLHKEPGRRFATAADLADDLRRFLEGRAVRARRLSPLVQGWRWCRRNPAVAVLAGALLLGAAIGFGGVIWGLVRAERARQKEAVARAEEARQREQAELALYYSRIALAEREWLANNVSRSEYLLDCCLPGKGQPDRRGFEWYYLKRLCHADWKTIRASPFQVRGLAYSPDGSLFALAAGTPNYTGGGVGRGELALWTATGHLMARFEGARGEVHHVTFSPDGSRLITISSDNKAYLWEVATRRLLHEFPADAAFSLAVSVTFSPDGQLVAIPTSETVELRRSRDGELVGQLRGHGGRVGHAVFSPDGTSLASTDAENIVRVWDLGNGRERWRTSDAGHALAFSHDGSQLAISTYDSLRVFKTNTGQLAAVLRGHNGAVRAVSWLPGGHRLVTAANDQTVRLWDATTGGQERIFRGHTAPVVSVACSPDGRWLISGDGAGIVKVWNPDRDLQAVELPPWGGMSALAFSADGRHILAASVDRGKYGISAFDPATGSQLYEYQLDLIRRAEWPLKYVDFSADGRFLVGPAHSNPATVLIWDTQSGKEVARLAGHRAGVRVVALSRDGAHLATAAWNRQPAAAGELIFWDRLAPGSGKARLALSTESPIQCMAFSPDGRTLFTGDLGVVRSDQPAFKHGRIVAWDVQTGVRLREWVAHGGAVQSLAVSPDGQTIASAAFNEEKGLCLWDAASGKLLHSLQAPPATTVVIFSPDGRRLAAAGYEGTVQLWDPVTGQDIFTLRGPAPQMSEHDANDTHIAFSPDGTRLAVNSWTKAIHLFIGAPLEPSKEAPESDSTFPPQPDR